MRMRFSPTRRSRPTRRHRAGPSAWVVGVSTAALVAALAVPVAVWVLGDQAQAATTVTDLTSDFEDGTTQGWNGASVDAAASTAVAAHGGTGVLAVTDTVAGWGAVLHDLKPLVRPGVQYTISAWVRSAAATGKVSLTVQQDSSYLNSGSYQVPVTGTGWTQLSRTYTLPADAAAPTTLQFYFEAADDLSTFYVDDVTVTHTEGATPAASLSNDFEDGAAGGWAPRGSVTVAASTDQAHAGTHSLLTTGRTDTWMGPALDVTGKVTADTQYNVSAWVRMASGDDSLNLTMQTTSADGTNSYARIGGQAAVTTTGWTQLSGQWTAPAAATGLVLYVEGVSATSSYYLDDFSLADAAGTAAPLPPGLVQVKDFGTNPGKLNMYVHVPTNVAAKAPLVVASHYCTGTAAAFYTGSDFGVGELVKASDRLGFVMVFPEATRDGHCFDPASPQALTRDGGSDPVSVKSMVDYAKAHWTIDAAKVYAVGASSGAMLTQVLLGNYPDVFAAGVSFMGVPHSCFATGSSTNLWNSSCADGSTVHTGAEWGDLVRGAYPGYTGARPRVQLWHGTDDTTISYNDLGEGVKQWTNVLGVPATPVATAQLEGTWTRKRYGTDTAAAPVEAISVSGLGHELPKAAMAPYVLGFLGLDTPVPDPTPTTPGSGPQTLLTHDFENGTTQGWTARGGTEAVANSTTVAHGGTHSLAVTGRTQSWNAPVVSLLGRVQPGENYSFSAWVRLTDGVAPTTAKLTMERRLGGTPSYEGITGAVPVTSTAWTHLSGTWTLASDVDFLKLYVETPGTEAFFVDDVQVTYTPTLPVQTDLPSLATAYASAWPRTGSAVLVPDTIGDHGVLLAKHFTSVTPGNAMKWDAVEPTKGSPNYADADRIVDFAQKNGLGVYGHVLAWHSQLPAWVFQDDAGKDLPVDAASKQLVLDRLTAHIKQEVGRYKGKVYAWDAANEVIDDADGVTYRNSKWYQYTGLDFIRTAFRVAHETDPAAELCINDYNSTQPVKRAKYYDLVKQLLAEGVPLTCVGHQMHVNIDYQAAELGQTLSLFQSLGVRQRITELDVSVYQNDTDVFTTVPAANLTKQEAVYKGIFTTLLQHASAIDSVTTWGLADDHTWLSTFPITRLNTPLLFDAQLQAKPVFTTVVGLPGTVTPPARVQTVTPASVTLATGATATVDVGLSGGWCLRTPADVVAVSRTSATTRLTAPITVTATGTFAAKLSLTDRAPFGAYDVYVTGKDCAGTALTAGTAAAMVGTFRAVASTAITVDAAPEPVRRGSPLAVVGQLKQLTGGTMQGYRNAKVVIEFRAKGATAFTPVRTVTTTVAGAFALVTTQTKDGTWQARYAGDADHAPASATDDVTVR